MTKPKIIAVVGHTASGKTGLAIALAERLGVNISELLDIPLSSDSSELSEDEIELITIYRKTHVLPKKMRRALKETLESTINMYLTAG